MGKTLTEAKFTERVAKELGISKHEAKRALDAQRKVAANALKQHGKVKTPFGILKVRHVPASKGGKKVFMPALGRDVVTKAKPATVKVRLTASQQLKDLVS